MSSVVGIIGFPLGLSLTQEEGLYLSVDSVYCALAFVEVPISRSWYQKKPLFSGSADLKYYGMCTET